jgi:MFS family permease
MRTLVAVLACFGFFWGAWAVSVAEIKSSLHVSDGQFGLLLSAALLAAAATNAVAGSLAERWGTKTALRRSLIAWAVLLMVGAAVGAPLALGTVLVGVVASGGAIDVVVNVAASAALAERPGRYVRFHARFNAGAVMGAVAVELLLQSGQSWRWIWLAVGIMALALADQCRRVDLPAGNVGQRHGLLEALRTIGREGYLLLAIALGTALMVEGGIDTWGVLFLRQVLASGLLIGAAAYVIGQGVATIARLTLGPAAGSLGARRGVALGAGLTALGLTLMAVAPSAVLAAIGLVVAAAGISVCFPLLIAHVSAEVDRPALIIGGMTSIGYVGFVVGPVLVGWLADTLGLRAGLGLLAVAALFVAVTPSRGARQR